MCGLVGLAGRLAYADELTMKRLFVFDYFRGPDSTGLAAIRSTGTDPVVIAKMASHPLNLFDSRAFDKALSAYSSNCFIGHNRLATTGAKNDSNAHPYRFGHIVGAHNGTLTKDSWKALEELSGTETAVDSMSIFAAIEAVGIEETVKHMEGAWALVWYDLEEGTLNWLRNGERPFWFALNEGHNKVYWASEWHMIKSALANLAESDSKLAKDSEGFTYFPTDVNTLYSIDLKSLESTTGVSSTSPLPDFRVKGEYKGRPTPPVVTRTYSGQYSGLSITGGNHLDPVVTTKPDPTTLMIVPEEDRPYGPFITRPDFEFAASDGCSFCLEEVKWGDKGITLYEEEGIVLCPTCSLGSNTRIVVKASDMKEYVTWANS